jgi:tetratricopeptide (TPR) repeat protein
MKTIRNSGLIVLGLLTGVLLLAAMIRPTLAKDTADEGFVGSSSCGDCHGDFYKLWATSHHGLGMQPATPEFVKKEIHSLESPIKIGKLSYTVEIEKGVAYMVEKAPGGEKRYPIEHVTGGKNVYFFLTYLERGKLQTMPLSFDVRKKEWYDTTQSMIRHFSDITDEAIHWTETPLTFNTSCYRCHVSQLETNYDLETDSYSTEWAEPGINCETCHGPAGEHVKVCRQAEGGKVPGDIKIIKMRDLTIKQQNDICAPCHAKMLILTKSFDPGERYFDHYGLFTLEDRDFYPDGRDLGENYKYTAWRMNPCANSGQLTCSHCHTSSGRDRFKGEKANQACLPCHEKLVKNAAAHGHHEEGSTGNKCRSCHMPGTVFARMVRHDHSFLPPTPEATKKFDSPNACNICHEDKDPNWANEYVGKWFSKGYQEPAIERGELIEAGRKRDWTKLPQMLEYITRKDRDEIVATSLIRLLEACPDPAKWPVLRKGLEDTSPLIRSVAAEGLSYNLAEAETLKGLLKATRDDYRLVRTRAALAVSPYPSDMLSPEDKESVEKASNEYIDSLTCSPDNYLSHYNLGNFYFQKSKLAHALDSYLLSAKLRPDSILPLVNSSIVYAQLGQPAKAEDSLKKALVIEPNNSEANFNFGLLVAGKGDYAAAEKHLRAALKTDPNMAEAAYNLGVLVLNNKTEEGIEFCRRAYKLRPSDSKYAYTLAFYLDQNNELDEAADVLKQNIKQQSATGNVYMLLVMIYEKQKKYEDARSLCRQALLNQQLAPQLRYQFESKLRSLPQ